MIEGVIYRYKSPSGKYYIGQTVNEEERRSDFLYEDEYAGPKINNARQKYGPENFEYTVLMKVTGDDEEVHKYLDILEIGFIRMYDSYNNGYNSTIGGGGRSGYKLSDEIKEKIRNKLKGHEPPNKGIKTNKPSWNKGIPMREESKRKMIEAQKGRQSPNKGKPMSEEQKRKISESLMGNTPWNKGIPMREDSKQKLSESLKGRSIWNTGKPWSEESRKKMSDSHKGKPAPNKGKPMSDEQKKKLREASSGKHRVYNPDGTYRLVRG